MFEFELDIKEKIVFVQIDETRGQISIEHAEAEATNILLDIQKFRRIMESKED
ncbi:hypothetical protein [Vagococcus fluvialis]|uniref:hypothetical protein n=1 Tax=Vagococcus fluvialis TaxID=2738 RepID=UPI003D09AEBE